MGNGGDGQESSTKSVHVYVAPDPALKPPEVVSVFLAGGITNCPNWQAEFLSKLEGDFVVYNPRRENFPIGDPTSAKIQIEWEYERLKAASAVVFWFSRGSLNPIVLYELGRWGTSSSDRPIFIGVDPEYARKLDVEHQVALAKPYTPVYDSLEVLATVVNEWAYKESRERPSVRRLAAAFYTLEVAEEHLREVRKQIALALQPYRNGPDVNIHT